MVRSSSARWITAVLVLLSVSGCDEGVVDPGGAPDEELDPLQDALDELAQLDGGLLDSLLDLPRIEDGIDEAEAEAIVALVAAIEAVAATDERAVGLLRSAGPAGHGDAVWATDPECSVDPSADAVETAASLDGNDLTVHVTTRGDLGADVAMVVNLDHGEGSLYTTQVAAWLDGDDLVVWTYEWVGPLVDSSWNSWATHADT